MLPTIAFHDIAHVELTPVQFFPDGARPAFFCRTLILTGADGAQFRVNLFANSVDALTLALEQTPLCPEQTNGD